MAGRVKGEVQTDRRSPACILPIGRKGCSQAQERRYGGHSQHHTLIHLDFLIYLQARSSSTQAGSKSIVDFSEACLRIYVPIALLECSLNTLSITNLAETLHFTSQITSVLFAMLKISRMDIELAERPRQELCYGQIYWCLTVKKPPKRLVDLKL